MDRENVYIIATVGKPLMYVFEDTVYNSIKDVSAAMELTEEQKAHLAKVTLDFLNKWASTKEDG